MNSLFDYHSLSSLSTSMVSARSCMRMYAYVLINVYALAPFWANLVSDINALCHTQPSPLLTSDSFLTCNDCFSN